jgi:glycerol-3-phosphate O-acyltransferase
MVRKSIRERLSHLEAIPERYREILLHFASNAEAELGPHFNEELFLTLFQLVEQQCRFPFFFHPYHQKIQAPFNYHRFALDFVSQLIDFSRSRLFGSEVVQAIDRQIERGDNVILLANHQVEPDPQVINLLLEKTHPRLASSIISVAGERVVTDPTAIPFSMGCDLLCIYSKRYIEFPPEWRAKKQLHNKQVMESMSRLLSEGGRCIYVAPSGGRDRKNSEGKIEVAPFDPDAIEMFALMARRSKKNTHFYPLALATYEIMPPPETIQIELGESRHVSHSPVSVTFCPEFPIEHFPGSELSDKLERRAKRAALLHQIVQTAHENMRATS